MFKIPIISLLFCRDHNHSPPQRLHSNRAELQKQTWHTIQSNIFWRQNFRSHNCGHQSISHYGIYNIDNIVNLKSRCLHNLKNIFLFNFFFYAPFKVSGWLRLKRLREHICDCILETLLQGIVSRFLEHPTGRWLACHPSTGQVPPQQCTVSVDSSNNVSQLVKCPVIQSKFMLCSNAKLLLQLSECLCVSQEYTLSPLFWTAGYQQAQQTAHSLDHLLF